ncbi:MAG TPA: hypothetical protein VH394_06200 [Thermoanaerobaculia bacterium]|jgi:hypothetical protein|nr:hypothetical protein [Thermoanaerobaculia bacterium]
MRAVKSGLFLILVAALALPAPSAAWSRKGHILIIRSAVKLLVEDPTTPPALRALLLEGLGDPAKMDTIEAFVLTEPYSKVDGALEPGLDLYSHRPDDLASNSPVPVFDNTEDRMHYLNLERFNRDPERRKYAPDGSNKPSLSDLPRDWKDERYAVGGFVTFRVQQAYDTLVASLAKDLSNEQIFLWMGFLSHYASDAYQPYHASLNYAGLLCPANQRREKPDRYITHGEFEKTIFTDESPAVKPMITVFWNQYKETLAAGAATQVQRLDPYVSTQEALLSSYDLQSFLCRAQEDALKEKDFNRQAWFAHTEDFGGLRRSTAQLQAERMALATLAVRTMIRQAWDDAVKIGNPPPVPPPPPPPPPPMAAPIPAQPEKPEKPPEKPPGLK